MVEKVLKGSPKFYLWLLFLLGPAFPVDGQGEGLSEGIAFQYPGVLGGTGPVQGL